MGAAAIPGSFQNITVTATPVGLTVPTTGYPKYALIACETNDVRWVDDGSTVSSSNGTLLKVGGVLKYDGDLTLIKFARATGSSGAITVSYYSV